MRLKRTFDFVLAGLLLVLLLPVLFSLALVVRVKLGTPVFFVQERPGKDGAPFNIVKFRTMRDDRDSRGVLLPDEVRLTRLGQFLRSTSLDELPELWNVLKGEMSFVGPRPLLMEYLPLYSDRQRQRHDVRPGITGWAQINGRNALTWEDKFELDVWYVENRSLRLDIRILWSTIACVFRREGITGDGQVTMAKFKGSHQS